MIFGLMEKIMQVELKYYKTDHGVSAVLVGEAARTRMPVIIIEHKGVMLRHVPVTDQRYMSDAPTKKRSMKAIAQQFRTIGNKLGISKPAKRFLSQIINAD